MEEDDNPNDDGLVVALLDFPRGGVLGLDGQNIVLRRDDFVGVSNLPPESVHLVTCKNGNHFANCAGTAVTNETTTTAATATAATNSIDTAVTVGFLVFGNGTEDRSHLVRRYDPLTEEVASEEASPIDELTRRNLLSQIQGSNSKSNSKSNSNENSNLLPPSRVLRYHQIVAGNEADALSPRRFWSEQTRYINASKELLLGKLRGLSSGDKIVPGCYDPDHDDESDKGTSTSTGTGIGTAANSERKNAPPADGTSPVYPPIPVVDPRVSVATHRHAGTKRFLSRLEPSERTALFVSRQKWAWLDTVLETFYQHSWEALLGDLQLSYLLFLHLGCYSSLGHWKDLLAMLSLAVVGGGVGERDDEDGSGNQQLHKDKHEDLYRGLLRLLPYQLSSMTDPEFLENVDEGGGNFLVPSLARLLRYYEARGEEPQQQRQRQHNMADEAECLSRFRHVACSKFPKSFGAPRTGPRITRLRSDSDSDSDSDSGDAGDDDGQKGTDSMEVEEPNHQPFVGGPPYDFYCDDDDDDDDDGPVVVSSEEIEASMARSSSGFHGGRYGVASLLPTDAMATAATATAMTQLRRDYPMLAAAIVPGEDVLMTCARALDQRIDVSLVREAAAYLEEVEQYQHRSLF
eukprot:CAMPEP_0172360512 /NCGR_PEP_ID=MMETSP1060-20121228/4520_1 /TAXON_ID=37318 /ORGANISM="Pseudo-nitzschia pungens, Strain cf. cingulata" /LENGTH=631 /DNA_ID=CAMNT_0013082521 /DNA_START=103 /DNA_END=1998 /DNA_ORIENTATION=+